MDTHPSTAARLMELEIKASYAEDLLDRLNDVVVRQQAQIDLLLREVALLHEQTQAGDRVDLSNPTDDLPPHY